MSRAWITPAASVAVARKSGKELKREAETPVEGGSDTYSYVSPGYVANIKTRDFDRQQGPLDDEILAEAIEALNPYPAASNQPS